MKKVRVELPFEVAVLVGEVLNAVADKGEADFGLGGYDVTLAEVKGVAEKLRFASGGLTGRAYRAGLPGGLTGRAYLRGACRAGLPAGGLPGGPRKFVGKRNFCHL